MGKGGRRRREAFRSQSSVPLPTPKGFHSPAQGVALIVLYIFSPRLARADCVVACGIRTIASWRRRSPLASWCGCSTAAAPTRWLSKHRAEAVVCANPEHAAGMRKEGDRLVTVP